MEEVEALRKRKRKELCGEGGVEDTDDPFVLALRWAESLRSTAQQSTGNVSVAVWLPRHRVAVLKQTKGKLIASFGETGVGGAACLLPEEALYLSERQALVLHDGGADTTLATFADCPSPAATPVLRAEELHGALTEAAGLPLACYAVYRTLRDRKLVVRRPLGLVVADSSSHMNLCTPATT